MPSIKELTQKIVSLKNTQKVTQTMKLISTSKLKKAQNANNKATAFITDFAHIALPLLNSTNFPHPLINQNTKQNNNKILVVIFSSDKGLCGGFNNNLFKKLFKNFSQLKNNGTSIDIITCGNRAYNFFSKKFNIIENYQDIASKVDLSQARKLATKLRNFFTSGAYQSIHLGYNKFESILKQTPSYERILPLTFNKAQKEKNQELIFEPNQSQILNFIIPKGVEIKIFSILLENSVGEHAARMAAMDSATTNGQNLINHYSTLRNRVRQSGITTELTEIVAGAESLK